MLNRKDKLGRSPIGTDQGQLERILELDIELFRGIESEALGEYLITGNVSLVKVAADTLLRQERARQVDIGILIRGMAEVRQYDNQGAVFTVGIVEPGDLFGEITAFVEGAGWPASVVTQTACEVLFIPLHLITQSTEHLDDVTRKLMQNLLGIIAMKALNLRSRIEILTRNSMRSRISIFLLQQATERGESRFSVQMNREGMSRYLNVSRPSMSRELGRMRDEGLIRFCRSEFEILDHKRLLEEAGVI